MTTMNTYLDKIENVGLYIEKIIENDTILKTFKNNTEKSSEKFSSVSLKKLMIIGCMLLMGINLLIVLFYIIKWLKLRFTDT